MFPVATTFLLATIFLLVTVGSAQIALGQSLGGCPVFPTDNIWNTRIDQLPVSPSSATWVATIGATVHLHPDFGSGLIDGAPFGIPYIAVPGTQQKYSATFLYADESDAGPYAIPLNAPIEGGSSSTGDRHAIAVDKDNCVLYELYNSTPLASSWKADSGAIFNLRSDALRTSSWTSADAAGLPIFPGLVRFDEVQAGEIRHAFRFTVPKSQKAYVWPARHYASSLTGTQYPPMGARFRLRADFDISHFSAANQVILTALKRYGMMLADNGSAWYISGTQDNNWNNDDLSALKALVGSNFEAVDVSPLMADPNSGQARQTTASISVSPASATVAVNTPIQFKATATNLSDPSVTWDVNGTVGGNASVGFIDSISGAYTSPPAPPAPATVTVHATSKMTPSVFGSATVSIKASQAVSLQVTPATATVTTGGTLQFSATVQGASDTSVTWKVKAVRSGSTSPGTISAQGLYHAPAGAVNVTITATSNADPTKSASASVMVMRPRRGR